MQIRKDLREILKKLNKVIGLEAHVVSLKNHVKIAVEYNGRRRYWITSSTPSDRNAIHAKLRDLKSILNDLGVKAMPEFSISFTTIGMGSSSCIDKNITALWSYLDTLEGHETIPQHDLMKPPATYSLKQARRSPPDLPKG
jgi:hypothetical protein